MMKETQSIFEKWLAKNLGDVTVYKILVKKTSMLITTVVAVSNNADY